MLDRPIQFARELLVPVTDRESALMVSWDGFPQLLQRPFRGRMGRHVAVKNLPCGMLDDHEHIENLEGPRGRHEEVTRHDSFGMTPEEGRPALIGARALRSTVNPLWHVPPDSAPRPRTCHRV